MLKRVEGFPLDITQSDDGRYRQDRPVPAAATYDGRFSTVIPALLAHSRQPDASPRLGKYLWAPRGAWRSRSVSQFCRESPSHIACRSPWSRPQLHIAREDARRRAPSLYNGILRWLCRLVGRKIRDSRAYRLLGLGGGSVSNSSPLGYSPNIHHSRRSSDISCGVEFRGGDAECPAFYTTDGRYMMDR